MESATTEQESSRTGAVIRTSGTRNGRERMRREIADYAQTGDVVIGTIWESGEGVPMRDVLGPGSLKRSFKLR